MGLNILSGRTNCDLNQYFVIPWVLADYDCRQKETISLRDLERNMGSCGTQERIDKFVEIKNVIEQNHKEEFIQPHFFGFHYSNIAIVLQYLVRVYPYAEGAIQMQGGKFDIPDRLFMSVAESYRNATTEMSDVRELIPEFFYFPELLLNTEHFDFGMQQNQRRVHDV